MIQVSKSALLFWCLAVAGLLGGCGTTSNRVSELPQYPVEAQRLPSPSEPPIPSAAYIPPVQCRSSESLRSMTERSISGWQQGYVQCRVNPLERYSHGSTPLKSVWLGESCINGLAHGAGFALWCSPGELCAPDSPSNHLLRAAGVVELGSMAKCPVEFSTKTTSFSGILKSSGDPELGKLSIYKQVNNQVVLVEGFTGRFASKSDYRAGAFLYGGKTIISASFGKGNLPRGEALVIEKSGETYLANCDGLVCAKIDKSLRLNSSDMQLVERAFTRSVMVSAESELLRRLLVGLFPRIAGGPLALAISVFVDAMTAQTL
jgi:hypothetical protein